MKKYLRRHSIILAALLQILPFARTLFVNPSASSAFAIIFRWAVGGAIAIESVDAVSGGSVVYIDSVGVAAATVGVPFTYYITLGGTTGTDKGGNVNGLPMPAGLTSTSMEPTNSNGDVLGDWGVISGIPLNVGTNIIGLSASHPKYQNGTAVTKNLTLYIYGTSTPLTVTNQPSDITATNRQTVTLSTGASGTGPITFQWYKGSTNIANHIPDATNANYVFKAITNSTTANPIVSNTAGVYLCKISGASGLIVSSNATLTISSSSGVSPTITNQPAGITNVAGSTASFSVLAGGTSPLKYQWRLEGTILSGATNTSYSIPAIHLSDAGGYTVVITNSSGAITSAVAQLGVTLPSSPAISPPVGNAGNQFVFTFIPVVGLTNTVQTNSSVGSGAWGTLTNIPPPPTATSLSVTDVIDSVTRFYRVLLVP